MNQTNITGGPTFYISAREQRHSGGHTFGFSAVSVFRDDARDCHPLFWDPLQIWPSEDFFSWNEIMMYNLSIMIIMGLKWCMMMYIIMMYNQLSYSVHFKLFSWPWLRRSLQFFKTRQESQNKSAGVQSWQCEPRQVKWQVISSHFFNWFQRNMMYCNVCLGCNSHQ